MSDKNNWAVIDANSTIHTGTEEDMRLAFDAMHLTTEEMMGTYDMNSSQAERWILKYKVNGWVGDLKLIQVHAITK